jgi:hypothetical protein
MSMLVELAALKLPAEKGDMALDTDKSRKGAIDGCAVGRISAS